MSTTGRLDLPFILPGQAQKENTHNEALARLDIALQASAEAIGLNAPPVSPEIGRCWIIGASPGSEWAGKPGWLAGWTEGGWRFLKPFAGMTVWLIGDGVFAHWDGVDWVIGTVFATSVKIGGEQIIGSRQPAIEAPSGGAFVDAEARSAVENILGALRAHGLINSAV